MFAVIRDGGKQYKVQPGDTLIVDYREGLQDNQTFIFEDVLLAGHEGASVIGRPTIAQAKVTAQVLHGLFKGPKLEIQKLRRRHASRRHTGHRQKYTQVRITRIEIPGLPTIDAPELQSVESTATST
ncbi:MAG: 50S ribosomal protein L21 [Planctomycetaceae bacterium]|nr:MAG: 50S ribosomal protein L21 [Planctomycetaceae bacterium]